MEQLARQAQNKQLEIDASEIRIRAERRLGEMLIEQKKLHGGLNKGGRPPKTPRETREVSVPPLNTANIDFDLSARAQQYAADYLI